MHPSEELLAKFVSEDLCHRNDLAGCIIWMGDMHPRRKVPMYEDADVRKYMYQLTTGDLRQSALEMRCENDRCINPSHIFRAESAAQSSEVVFSPDELQRAIELKAEGYTLEAIAQKMDTSKTRVSRILKASRSAKGIEDGEGAE